MGIKMVTSDKDVLKAYSASTEQQKRAIRMILEVAGEKGRNEAVSLPSPPVTMRERPHQPNYIDDSANLRNSIGYVIVEIGRKINPGKFGRKGGDSTEGVQAGRRYADQLAGEPAKGISLIFVAGMRYASYVQDRGYNVIASAVILMRREVNRMLNRIRR